MFLPVTEAGRVPVTPQGQPVYLAEPVGDIVVTAGAIHAFLVDTESAERLGTLRDATFFNGQRDILKALHLIRNRREARFDPRTGRELSYPAPGAVGHDGERLVFPRLDPAVIGIIRHPETDRILLARNRHRSGFFSLIAGYVDPGETLEEAMVREALEETGRRVESVCYWGSQPWPPSGSLMVGFSAVTEDVRPVCDIDGELAEVRWVSRAELPELTIARKGSIAHTMIMEWFHGDETGSVPAR